MDFEVPKPIQTALKQRIEHPILAIHFLPKILGILFVTGQNNNTIGIFKRMDCL